MREDRVYVLEFVTGLALSVLGGACFYYSGIKAEEKNNTDSVFVHEDISYGCEPDYFRYAGSTIVTSIGLGLLVSGARTFNRKI